MTPEELKLANDAYDEMTGALDKAGALRQNLAYDRPVSAPEYVAYAEDVHVAISFTINALARLVGGEK